MRQLRTLLKFAARTLANSHAGGGLRDPLHLHGARAATAAGGRQAGLDARSSWPSPGLAVRLHVIMCTILYLDPGAACAHAAGCCWHCADMHGVPAAHAHASACRLQSFATDDGPPHRGQREQSGEDAAQDWQQLAREQAASEALAGSDPADAAAAAASPEARPQPGDTAATDAQAADAAAAADADVDADIRVVKAEFAKMGIRSADGSESDGEGIKPLDISQLSSSSGV